MKIRIKYLPGAKKLTFNPKGDWVDLYAYEDKEYMKDDWGILSLGFAMELPEGYEAEVKPRSSTFKTWGVVQTNSVAAIDNSFSGNDDIWFWPWLATRDGEFKKGDKICQMRIRKKQPDFVFEEVETLDNDNRGCYGSSGTR